MAFNNINSVDISENGDDFINFDIALDEFQQNDGDILTQTPSVQLHPTRISDVSGKESEMRRICNICEKTFTLKSNLTRHMKTHTDEKSYICSICQKGFYRNADLSRHAQVHARVKKTYTCSQCKSEFTKKSVWLQHMHLNHPKVKKIYVCEQCKSEFAKKSDFLEHRRLNHPKVKKTHVCEQCKSVFSKKSDLFKHIRVNHPYKEKTIKSYSLKRRTQPPRKTFKCESTALGVNSTSVFEPSEEANGDILTFFSEARPEVQYKLITQLEEKRGIKWYAVLELVLSRMTSDGDMETFTPHFCSKCIIELLEDTIEEHLEQAFQKIINSFENFTQRGSGWTLEKIIHLELICCTYKPLAVTGSPIPFEEPLE